MWQCFIQRVSGQCFMKRAGTLFWTGGEGFPSDTLSPKASFLKSTMPMQIYLILGERDPGVVGGMYVPSLLMFWVESVCGVGGRVSMFGMSLSLPAAEISDIEVYKHRVIMGQSIAPSHRLHAQ